MNKKVFIVLTSLIITILALAVIINKSQGLFSGAGVKQDNFKFEKLTIDNITKIEFVKNSGTVTLEKRDGAWMIGEDRANASDVEAILNQISTANIKSTASTNPENHATFEVDDEAGAVVKFYKDSDNIIEAFIAGKYASGGGMYIRKEGGDNVYVLSESISTYLTRTEEDWKEVVEETEE